MGATRCSSEEGSGAHSPSSIRAAQLLLSAALRFEDGTDEELLPTTGRTGAARTLRPRPASRPPLRAERRPIQPFDPECSRAATAAVLDAAAAAVGAAKLHLQSQSPPALCSGAQCGTPSTDEAPSHAPQTMVAPALSAPRSAFSFSLRAPSPTPPPAAPLLVRPVAPAVPPPATFVRGSPAPAPTAATMSCNEVVAAVSPPPPPPPPPMMRWVSSPVPLPVSMLTAPPAAAGLQPKFAHQAPLSTSALAPTPAAVAVSATAPQPALAWAPATAAAEAPLQSADRSAEALLLTEGELARAEAIAAAAAALAAARRSHHRGKPLRDAINKTPRARDNAVRAASAAAAAAAATATAAAATAIANSSATGHRLATSAATAGTCHPATSTSGGAAAAGGAGGGACTFAASTISAMATLQPANVPATAPATAAACMANFPFAPSAPPTSSPPRVEAMHLMMSAAPTGFPYLMPHQPPMQPPPFGVAAFTPAVPQMQPPPTTTATAFFQVGHMANAVGTGIGVHGGASFLTTPAAYSAAAPLLPMMPSMSVPFGTWQHGMA